MPFLLVACPSLQASALCCQGGVSTSSLLPKALGKPVPTVLGKRETQYWRRASRSQAGWKLAVGAGRMRVL